jgi:hypothetical protein
MDAHDTSGDGKTPEDIIGRGNQALRIMTTSFMLEATFGIKLTSDLLCCRKVVLGAIESDDRHGMPQIRRMTRIEAVGQIHGTLQDVPEKGPANLFAGLSEAASMDLIGFGPKAASLGSSEEFTRFDVHSLALSTAYEREDKDDELGKGKLARPGEILSGLLGFGGNFFGDEAQKTRKDRGNLACIFMAGSVP